jgi:uncharacterized protein (TIGR02300 family)
MPVAKPEWGVKRVCQSCAAKFYDLGRSPITCPKCAAPFDPEALLKSRRSRPTPAKAAKPAKPVALAGADTESGVPLNADAVPDDISDEIVSLPGDGDSDDDSVPVDASELGDDDVSVVVVPSDDDS